MFQLIGMQSSILGWTKDTFAGPAVHFMSQEVWTDIYREPLESIYLPRNMMLREAIHIPLCIFHIREIQSYVV